MQIEMQTLELSDGEANLLRSLMQARLDALRSVAGGEAAAAEIEALSRLLRRIHELPEGAIGRGPAGEAATPSALLTDVDGSIVRRYWEHDGLSADPAGVAQPRQTGR